MTQQGKVRRLDQQTTAAVVDVGYGSGVRRFREVTGGETVTVNELVQLLVKYPPGLRVVVKGYENGYDDLSPEQLSMVRIALNTGKHPWEGQHGDPNGRTERGSDGAEVVEALVLQRVSN